MAVIVIDKGEGVVMELGGEAEGIFGDEVAVGDAGGAVGAGDGAEGGVVVVGGDAVLEGVVEDLGDVLVAVVGVEEIEVPILGTHDERTRSGHRESCRRQSGSAWRPVRRTFHNSPRDESSLYVRRWLSCGENPSLYLLF